MTTPEKSSEALFRLIVAAPMKSASTYCSNFLSAYFNVPPLDLPNVDWLGEHNLTQGLCYDVRGKSFCFNYHMLPHAANLAMLQAEGMGIVGLWRNIGDMIVSMDDHEFKEGINGPAMFIINHDKLRSFPVEARHQFMIDVLTPWYVSFYLRWRAIDMVLHPYEEMLRDPRAYFVEILSWVLGGRPMSDTLIDSLLNIGPGPGSRFNVGVAGRSAGTFSESCKRRIEHRILRHPDVEQLEILLWELPWDVPAIAPRSPLDGMVVQSEDDPFPYFVSRGVKHVIDRPAWLRCRVGERRTPVPVAQADLAALPVGESMI